MENSKRLFVSLPPDGNGVVSNVCEECPPDGSGRRGIKRIDIATPVANIDQARYRWARGAGKGDTAICVMPENAASVPSERIEAIAIEVDIASGDGIECIGPRWQEGSPG